MKRKAKEGKLDFSQPEGSRGIEKAREEGPWLWGTSQLAAWDQNVAFKEPASQQWTDDENWQAGPRNPIQHRGLQPRPGMLLQC